MNNTDPLVSIVIPVYNGSNFIRKAIDSALGQTYKNIEVIVVNDGSSDGGETEKIALSYGDRIRYIRKENGGVSTALNTGIRAMRGKYFSWLSHDDEYTPEKIQIQVQQLERYPEEKLIALCGTRRIDINSSLLKNVYRDPAVEPDRVIDWKSALYDYFKMGDYFGCALLIPKEALEASGLFNERLRYSQDCLMWMKILLSGYSLIYSDKICALKRRHKKQQTNAIAHLYYSDNEIVADTIMPRLIEASRSGGNVLYWFACSRARYNHQKIVKKCIALGRENGLLSTTECLKIYLYSLCGRIRPIIRKVYRKLNRLY